MEENLSSENQYIEKDIRLARIAKALSHPARIAIIRHIASTGNCFFNEISEGLPLAGSTVSQHLTELKKTGLIKSKACPPNVMYSINIKEWKLARKYLKKFMNMDIAGDSKK